MRDIKFRAWSQLGDEMLYQANIRHLALAEFETKSNLVWMQYTGLKDKNGVEIYDGDILRSDCDVLYVVAFYNFAYDHINPDVHEVIGNIYENPELLNEMD